MLIKKKDRKKIRNSEDCVVYEYNSKSDLFNIATASINGTYPKEGLVTNLESEEYYYVLDGHGRIHSEKGEFEINKSDVYHFAPKEKYWVEGSNLELVIVNAPPFDPKQHINLPDFNENNYPKSYGSVKTGDYRLKPYLKRGKKELALIENHLWNCIVNIAETANNIKKFNKYKYIDSGWEWSVFKLNERQVIKIPSGKFKEVNDPRYLENAKRAYKLVNKYFNKNNLVKTEFVRENNTNTIVQDFVKGSTSFAIGYNTKNKLLLENIKRFLNDAIRMLRDYGWIPDFNVVRRVGGVYLENIIIEELTFIPKIIDYTSYFDVFRMYPAREKYEIHNKLKNLRDFKKWVSLQLKNI